VNQGKQSLTDAWAEEESLKDQVYQRLETELADLRQQVENAEKYVRSGAFEEQEAFTAHGTLADRLREEQQKAKEYISVLRKPYFAHMQISQNGQKVMQFMLSDNPDLEHFIQLGNGRYIFPFKQDPRVPMGCALFGQYSKRTSGEFTVSVQGNETSYFAELLRDVEIADRELRNLVQYYPDLLENSQIDVDDILAKRLEENRTDAKLRNIIATLQNRQFEIVRSSIDESFVVQGCAGSGKTQCLIHRLFFLRADLDDRGWQKVLLITPTQLFRDYSNELMRRYRLTSVTSLSLANLYQILLSYFDPRFKQRQYEIKLTEEYLPDNYLKQVYDKEQIRKVESEILRAVNAHVDEAKRLLGKESEAIPLNAESIAALANELNDAIIDFDERLQMLDQNAEYREHMEALDKAEKEISSINRKREALETSRGHLGAEYSDYERLSQEISLADNELKVWKEEHVKEVDALQQDYFECLNRTQDESTASLSALDSYRRAMFRAFDISMSFGAGFRRAQVTQELLEELLESARKDLLAFTKGKTERTWLRNFSERKSKNESQIQEADERLRALQESVETHSEWIRNFTSSGESIQDQRQGYRASLERAKYYLSRIESCVFEQEVWDTLSPLKEKCGIQTLRIEQGEDGRQKQTRILYKSDLLFYLEIYLILHKTDRLPEYTLICVDEGQDLHGADYDLLKRIYPKAVLNVFGDTAQVLHESCGVSDWERDTGLSKVYSLDTNYRNVPDIAEFCNQNFHQKMKYIGKADGKNAPLLCEGHTLPQEAIKSNDSVIIVKDRDALKTLCMECGLDQSEIVFLDTTAETAETDKLRCYSVFAAKGLEFRKALVFVRGMTDNQKTVACTRAMERLYYYE